MTILKTPCTTILQFSTHGNGSPLHNIQTAQKANPGEILSCKSVNIEIEDIRFAPLHFFIILQNYIAYFKKEIFKMAFLKKYTTSKTFLN